MQRPATAFRPGLPGAVALHVALIAWFASLSIQQLAHGPNVAEQAVEVELQTLEQFEALNRREPISSPPAAAVSEPAPAPAPPPPPAAEPVPPPSAPAPPDGMVAARRLLSQQVLADPRSREALATLPLLAPDERVEQLCGLEAMGQIHDWRQTFEPDRVTAYAMAETRQEGAVLKAEGAAFRSKRRWYALRFECTLSPDRTRVTAFAFHVGEPIPAARWQALGLPAVH